MKTAIVCTLAFVAFVNGQEVHSASPYERIFRRRSIEGAEVLQVCVPSSTKKIECNSCFCMKDGSGWACTEMACNVRPIAWENPSDYTTSTSQAEPSQRVKRELDNFRCVPNTTFKQDCNTCFCSADGRDAMCTLKGCWNPIRLETRPTPSPVHA